MVFNNAIVLLWFDYLWVVIAYIGFSVAVIYAALLIFMSLIPAAIEIAIYLIERIWRYVDENPKWKRLLRK